MRATHSPTKSTSSLPHTSRDRSSKVNSQFMTQTVRDMKDSYESNEGEEQDINEIQRRNLKSLLLIDFQMVDMLNSNNDQSNLFLLKKGKKINEQLPELKKNFQDI